MELEFDKEMDAILRKTARASGTAVPSPHLDADVIAAFAENALPQRSRAVYTRHLADCDRCRKVLSQTISIGERAVEKAVAAPIAASMAEAAVPWYTTIFRTPNLAIAMGGLILVFTGVLGFLVLQNSRSGQDATVSQVSEPEMRQSGPFADEQQMLDSANSNASVLAAPANTSAAANTASNTSASVNGVPTSPAASVTGVDAQKGLAGETSPASDDENVSAREIAGLPKPAERQPFMTAAPPPPPPTESAETARVLREEAKKDAEIDQAERSDASLAAKKRSVADGRSRDVPPAAAKVGPARSGPVQMQSNQVHNNAGDISVTRTAGGKKFTNRDDAWYDTAYRGQATTNVRRGTEEFKKLDSGLRSIASRIEGVVVVQWKDKAFRIQ